MRRAIGAPDFLPPSKGMVRLEMCLALGASSVMLMGLACPAPPQGTHKGMPLRWAEGA